MTEETKHDMEVEDFEILLLESAVRGYLYELQYSEEQLRLMEEQEAAACHGRGARTGSSWADCWCLCSRCALRTQIESVCCREFQRWQFLLDEISESDEHTDVCVVM